jgi:hypothetical protein
MNTIYSRVSEISNEIKNKTSDLLSLSISLNDYTDIIRDIMTYKENRGLILNGRDRFAASFAKAMGVKRLVEFKKVLLMINPSLYRDLP